MSNIFKALVAGLLLCVGMVATAQSCAYRGELDESFCDANHDLVADTPLQSINPGRLIIGISSTEDARTAEKTYSPLVSYLGVCLKRDVQLHPPVGESNVLEALRKGHIHVAQFATGGTMFAVNFAGGVPFVGKGLDSTRKRDNYTLMLITRSDSSYRKPADLLGKKIAHTSATSNSGNLAPRALFPALGLTPEKDYVVEFSGKHDKSIMGVSLGLYDAAAVASDVFDRLVAKGDIKRNQFRVLYESDEFPPDAFSYAHNLDLKLVAGLKKCFADFKFPDTMAKLLEGNNRFFPVDYNRDWKLVRQIAKSSGTKTDRAAYDKIVTPK
jgi:phosphonate transport system substrate-binding protein